MIKKYVPLCLLLFFSITFNVKHVFAQIRAEEEPKMLYWEHTHPVKKWKDARDFREIFHKDRYLLGKRRISGNLSYNTGRVLISNNGEDANQIRNAIGIFTRIRFYEEFSFNTTFFIDFNKKAATRWISDYNYSIGRYAWKPNKLNFGYENYINNKYSDNLKTFTQKFLEGYYFLSYGHTLPPKLAQSIKIDSSTYLKFTYFTRYSINYRDEFEQTHGGLFKGKPTVGGGARLTLFRNIYIESAAYFYFNPKVQQQPWDPDYTYGFGYFDYRSFRCSLTYGNWAVNRFPWNPKTSYKDYGFVDGNFRFIINYSW